MGGGGGLFGGAAATAYPAEVLSAIRMDRRPDSEVVRGLRKEICAGDVMSFGDVLAVPHVESVSHQTARLRP